jgi:hypothetical protein
MAKGTSMGAEQMEAQHLKEGEEGEKRILRKTLPVCGPVKVGI